MGWKEKTPPRGDVLSLVTPRGAAYWPSPLRRARSKLLRASSFHRTPVRCSMLYEHYQIKSPTFRLSFLSGDPEGSRTPDLQDENLTSWTTRRRGHFRRKAEMCVHISIFRGFGPAIAKQSWAGLLLYCSWLASAKQPQYRTTSVTNMPDPLADR